MTERAFERVRGNAVDTPTQAAARQAREEAAVRKAQEQQRGGVMASTDQAGLTGRTSEAGVHYHNGDAYSDEQCRCELSQAAQPCGLDECDCHLHA